MNICIYICIYIYMYIYIYTYALLCLCMFMDAHMCMYIHVYVYIFIYNYICICVYDMYVYRCSCIEPSIRPSVYPSSSQCILPSMHAPIHASRVYAHCSSVRSFLSPIPAPALPAFLNIVCSKYIYIYIYVCVLFVRWCLTRILCDSHVYVRQGTALLCKPLSYIPIQTSYVHDI